MLYIMPAPHFFNVKQPGGTKETIWKHIDTLDTILRIQVFQSSVVCIEKQEK